MLRYSSESLESNLWCVFNLNFNTVFTGWAKPKQSCQQPSSPALPGKQTGVREKGFCYCWTELAWLLTPVVVGSMNSVQPRNKKTLIKKIDRSHQNEMTHLKILWYICPPNCCKVCMPLCCGIHSCWMLLLGNSVCLVKVNVPCYIRVTCYMPQCFVSLFSPPSLFYPFIHTWSNVVGW